MRYSPRKLAKLHEKMKYLSTDSWRGWCDAVYWCDDGPHGNMWFRGGDVVFCKIDEVLRFFESVRLTRRKIILVTGEGDLPCDSFRQKFLPANVAHWFATNVTQRNPRVSALPLGLGSTRSPTTLHAAEIACSREAGAQRDRWLYVNFRSDTNPAIRQPAFQYFKDHPGVGEWITFQPPLERGNNAKFLDALVRHRFVLCPPGNGVDTHRMWESLLAGAIPVVIRSLAMEPFSHLPVLFVDDYRQVTRELLGEALRRIEVPAAPSLETENKFWGDQIRSAENELAGREMMGWGQWVGASVAYGAGMMRRLCRTVKPSGTQVDD